MPALSALFCTVLLAGAADDAPHWHAQAMLAAADGDADAAVELLERAHEAEPQHPLYAFDLARVALDASLDADELEEAARPFLRMQPGSADDYVLRGTLALRLGRRQMAARALRSAQREDPGHPGVARLGRAISRKGGAGAHVRDQALTNLEPHRAPAPTPAPEDTKKTLPVAFALRLGATLDSNVTILPQDAVGESATQLDVQTQLAYTPLAGTHTLQLIASLGYSRFLYNRDNTGQFDTASVTAAMDYTYTDGPWQFHAQVAGLEMWLDSFNSHFLQLIGASLDASREFGPVRLGVYGNAVLRDFISGNVDNHVSDRDGPRVTGGLSLQGRYAMWTATLSAGWQVELPQGDMFREHGPSASFSIAGQLHRTVTWNTLVSFERREHDAFPGGRVDHLFLTSTSLHYRFYAPFALYGSYVYARNLSLAEFDYHRHLGSVGLEVAW